MNGKVCKLKGAKFSDNMKDKMRFEDYFEVANPGSKAGEYLLGFRGQYEKSY